MQEERGKEQASSGRETKVGGPHVSNSPPLAFGNETTAQGPRTAGRLNLSRYYVCFPLFLQETLAFKSPILNVDAKNEVSGNEETRLSRGDPKEMWMGQPAS